MRPLRAAIGRRRVLSGFAATAGVGVGGCVPAVDGGLVSATDLYVGLGRARTVVVLDSATDEERRRVSLGPLGSRSVPWRIGVGPTGNAAVVPLTSSEPNVGVIASSAGNGGASHPPNGAPGRPQAGNRGRAPRQSTEQCELVRVGTGRPRGSRFGVREMAETLAADGRGRAYVLIGDGGIREPSYAAVVDLARSATLRHLPLAPAGETVFALAGAPEGDQLFVSIWAWDEPSGRGPTGAGRLVAIDTGSGTPLMQAALTTEAVVTDVTLAAPPGAPAGARRALYAVVADPGPSRLDDDWWTVPTTLFLAALDLARLDPISWWPLVERPTSVAVTPDGTRAYLVSASVGWATYLSCLDLRYGAVTHRWRLPGGCVGLALSPVGKVYVADPFGDRLWRVDTSTNTLLEPLPITGAPIALATT